MTDVLFPQLAAIPNIKTSVEMAEALINKHDYRSAVERLGEAIEVCIYSLHTVQRVNLHFPTVLPVGRPFEGAESSVL
jgi:hypothetical protein